MKREDKNGYLMVINAGSKDWSPSPKELDALAASGIDAMKSIIPNPKGGIAVLSLRNDIDVSLYRVGKGTLTKSNLGSKLIKKMNKNGLIKGKKKIKLLKVPSC